MAVGLATKFALCNEEWEAPGGRPGPPGGPGGPSSPREAHREMRELLRDGRMGMLVCGIVIAGVTAGFALEEPLLETAMRTAPASVVCVVLLIALAVSMARTASLVIVAGVPLVDEMGELRRRTGSPVDPTAPWTQSGGSAGPFPGSGWDHVRAVLAAAHVRSVRIHQAVTWAMVTVGCFFAWTVAVLVTV
ncbi:MAG: hypothetical protein J2P30_18560 [Actinobacteria bacterium]|nr:hypothetical protein [Actinomycetota bacterium]